MRNAGTGHSGESEEQYVPLDYVMCSLITCFVVENKQAGFFRHPKCPI
jgi:hypothetical protein